MMKAPASTEAGLFFFLGGRMAHQADYERIGRFIYGFHRFASPKDLRALPGSGTVPVALAERGLALAQRFEDVLADWQEDARLGRADSVSEERIAALMEEAHHFAGELAYAREAGGG